MGDSEEIDSAAREARIRLLETELAIVRERARDLTGFIETMSLGLHWIDPDGAILWANKAELDLLGYTRDEYVGHNIREFHVDAPVVADFFHRLGNQETVTDCEARLRCKDGGIRHVLISSNVRWNQSESIHTRCFTRDITDQKRYEKRLLVQSGVGRILSESSSLADAAPGLLKLIGERLGWRAGLLWVPRDGLLRCASCWEASMSAPAGFTAMCQDLAFAPGVGLPGRIFSGNAPDWIADLSLDQNFQRQRAAAECGLRSAFGFPIMLGDTAHGVVEFFAEETRTPDIELLNMVGALGYQIGEFIERTRAQEQLAQREESYRVLTETAPDGIITMDAAGVILFVNEPAARIFGYTTAELLGADAAALIPEYFGTLHKAMGVVPLTGQHRHGHEIPLEVSFGEYRQGNKHVAVGVLRDVTERNRLNEKMRQTAKLESLGVLAGGIAHDFNNLLTGILGNVSLALDTVEDNDPANEMLQNALEASERAAHLTQQMLAYAGKGRFVVQPLDVSALVRQISILVKSSIPKSVTVRLDLEPSLPPVDADVAQLQQLVMNLVINGAEAVPHGSEGTVLVITRSQEVDAEYIAETFGGGDIAPGNYVSIAVHDNGAGMDDATMAKIFDPFFSTKFTGRGLGLAAALGIVRGHKGALKVFSTPGQGTTFKVLLPVTTAEKQNPAPKAARPNLVGTGTILVVDDESVVRDIATTALKRYGYTALTANNGREGVDLFRASHKELAMVLLDLTMPVMNGEQALVQMKAIDSDVPVVLTSGFNETEAIRRFDGKGLGGFIQKPYTAAALAEKIRTVLREAQRAVEQ
jgi:PAS domain S-box-containing protein